MRLSRCAPVLALLPVVALVAACLSAGAGGPDLSRAVHLVVLHTNDVHGQVLPRRATWIEEREAWVGGLPRAAAYVEEVRREVRGPREGLLVLDAGDWFQGTPEGMLDEGLPFAKAMGMVDFDAMCVGNHEFDRGVDNLRRILKRARLPAVLANVREPGADEPVPWCEPYRIVRRAGLRIALVGLLTPGTPEITHPDASEYEFVDTVESLAHWMEVLEGQVDLVVPLTHQGIEDDVVLAQAFPDLPLIVGGHSHTFLREGVREGDTLVVQAGAKAGAVGRVDLWFDEDEGRVVHVESRLVDLYEEHDPERGNRRVDAACAKLVAKTEEALSETVGHLEAPLERGRDVSSSPAGNWITDLMRARAGADVAIQNRGGIRTALAAGPVTLRDLIEILPFGNTLTTIELSGAELRESVRRAVESTDHSGIEFSGMRVRVRLPSEDRVELVDVEVGGRPLDPDGRYTVATNSFLVTGGDGYFGDVAERAAGGSGPILRELLEDELRAKGRVTPPTENRYLVTPMAPGAPEDA